MSQSALVKVGLPSHLAEGARNAKRVQQILDMRAAAIARIEADFLLRIKAAVAETQEELIEAVAAESEQRVS